MRGKAQRPRDGDTAHSLVCCKRKKNEYSNRAHSTQAEGLSAQAYTGPRPQSAIECMSMSCLTKFVYISLKFGSSIPIECKICKFIMSILLKRLFNSKQQYFGEIVCASSVSSLLGPYLFECAFISFESLVRQVIEFMQLSHIKSDILFFNSTSSNSTMIPIIANASTQTQKFGVPNCVCVS